MSATSFKCVCVCWYELAFSELCLSQCVSGQVFSDCSEVVMYLVHSLQGGLSSKRTMPSK